MLIYTNICSYIRICILYVGTGLADSGEERVGQAFLSCLSFVPAGTSAAQQVPTLLRSLMQISLPADECMAPRGKARFFDRLT